jgi:hypothetical protein
MAKKTQDTDFGALVGINSAADFYGWKKKIVDEVAKTDGAFAARLEGTGSLMDFFMLKPEILGKLGAKKEVDGND